MNESRLKALILSLNYAHTASYFDDWQQAFHDGPLFEPDFANIAALAPARLKRSVDGYDVIILLHSCVGDTIEHLTPLTKVLQERRRARLVSFIGNEFNSPHCPLGNKIDALKQARVDLVATQLPREAGDYLYGDFAKVAAVPHALNDVVFRPRSGEAAPKIDIGFRGFRYNALIGDNERDQLIDSIEALPNSQGLRIDIDWQQRFDQKNWATFLQGCAGTVSAEAGSWYLDRDDRLVKRIYEQVAAQRRGIVLPDHGALRGAFRRLPRPIKQAAAQLLRIGPVKFAGFEDSKLDLADLKRDFFDKAPKCPAYSKCISSRHFDAIGTKTCQILLEGRYNDILVPGEHYIAVKHDRSNLGEAIEQFKDIDCRQAVADRAWQHVMDKHRYKNRIFELYSAIAELR